MSKVSLAGAPTGTATFDIVAPATNTNRTLTLPDATGPMPVMQLLTAKTATGTAVDFLNIPAWVKRITVMFSGVSANGTSAYLIQLGSGSFVTTGYLSMSNRVAGNLTSAGFTTGLGINIAGAADTHSGFTELVNRTGNEWSGAGTLVNSGSTFQCLHSGSLSLPSVLDRIRITTVSGTDTFDAGTINLLLEGY